MLLLLLLQLLVLLLSVLLRLAVIVHALHLHRIQNAFFNRAARDWLGTMHVVEAAVLL